MKIDLKQLAEGGGGKKLSLPLLLSGVVLLANLAFYGLWLPGIEAETAVLQAEQSKLDSEIGGLEGNIAELQGNLGRLGELTASYKDALAKGAFEPENRLKANEQLADIKARHVTVPWLEATASYKLTIDPGNTFAFSADGQSHQWFASLVKLDIDMIQDQQYYEFAYDAMNSLNGYALLKRMKVERKAKADFMKDLEKTRKEGKGQLPMAGYLDFLWVTYPASSVDGPPAKGRK